MTVCEQALGQRQAMLTTEPLDTTDIVDVLADLSILFVYLTNSDTDTDNADLCSTRRWAWYLQGPSVLQVLERLVLQVQLLAASVRDVCAPRGCTDTHTGGTSRAGEGAESRDGLGDERSEAAQACSGIE
ncbi:hypothetical protein K432DRAFT_455751 [Lepidopterella palustris CBS 459.81]|uniref:Uncharacterized protein n=1 Tax=Lepidopterella palustris CBS 459.81 TaxID=1314670 RepID=A0A8E2DW12_9PEZI|nr:hypothetical protein K432DRAFT_455751 [Lepidopterella palustris CBS 459.81]